MQDRILEMKNISIFLWIFLIICTLCPSQINGYVICIDPGHGGPTAQKYGYNQRERDLIISII